MLCCLYGRFRHCRVSAQSDAKVVCAPDKTSATANAAGAGHTKVVQLLPSYANDAAFNGSRCALHWAAAGKRNNTVELLIKHGIDVHRPNPLLASCGSMKVDHYRIAVAELLMKEGADVNASTHKRKTTAGLLIQSVLTDCSGRILNQNS